MFLHFFWDCNYDLFVLSFIFSNASIPNTLLVYGSVGFECTEIDDKLREFEVHSIQRLLGVLNECK